MHGSATRHPSSRQRGWTTCSPMASFSTCQCAATGGCSCSSSCFTFAMSWVRSCGRSYILPRQVLGIGRFAWLANGTLWVCFHLFFAWDMLALLPIALLIALAVQWRRSAWIGIVAHVCLNSVTWPLLWAGITHG